MTGKICFRHFGDIGNMEEDSNGNVVEEKSDYLLSLLGPFSILGRALVVSTTCNCTVLLSSAML